VATQSTNRIPGLSSDFTDYAAPRHRVSISGHGETKTGKSSFAYFAPDPVVHFNLDRRVERVVDRFVSGEPKLGLTRPRIIKQVLLRLPQPQMRHFTASKDLRDKDETERKLAESLWNKFVKNYKEALESSLKPGGVKSIAIDTLTELYDLRLLAEFGRLMGFRQRERGGANSDVVELLRMSEDYSANLITLHQVKDEYARTKKKDPQTGELVDDSEKTGRRIIKGYDKTPYITQAHLIFKYNDQKRRFEVEVERCGLNAEMNRVTYTEDDWAVKDEDGGYVLNYGPFAFIAAQMTGTDPSEWSGE
jgi:hypothetical protein